MKILLNLLVLLVLSGCQEGFNLPSGSASSGAGPGEGTFGIIMTTFQFIMLGFFAYYFIVLKPQTQEQDENKKFLDGLQKNLEVVTTGGIIGRVVEIKSEIVTLEISPKVNIRVMIKEIRPFKKEEKNSAKG
jgi:preprotein translocase subunit YajC